MAKRFKLRELEQRHGDLDKVIPALANAHGQAETARQLETTQATISNWLKNNHYRKNVTYVKELA